MPFYFFHWTDEIIEHLLLNDVAVDDFEAVVCDPSSAKTSSRSSGLPARIGIAEDGRVLFCVFRWANSGRTEIEPVTAYEIDD